MSKQRASDVIAALGLSPHPEGGWYRETFRDPNTDEAGRARATLIYFLLEADRPSAWHRVDAAEMWLWHMGAPLALTIAEKGRPPATTLLGAGLAAGQRPHAIVPGRAWQTATAQGGWSLVSCAVAPGFEFEGFEMAPEGWTPAEI